MRRLPTASRREWLAGILAGATAQQLALGAQVSSKAAPSKLAMPGLYRGRVVEVEHPGSIVNGVFQGEAIHRMMFRGMTALTGAPDVRSAWGQLFEPGDVVGVKLNPVGSPNVIGSREVLHEIVFGLKSAGVKAQDIVVYDRYRAQFVGAGFDKWLPEGVRWMSAAEDYERVQQGIEGYDPDHYVDFPVTLPEYDLSNLTARRSYAAKFITKEVNKLVNVALLKDHQSAGVTLALKNLSHGLVNNVNRSHSTRTLNVCGAFIPAVVSMPAIRNKAVLHILDGVKALYHGGPGARPQFVWEHKRMWFATDPVALDRVGWRELDRKRAAVGMKPIAEDRADQFSTYLNRQPEHVEIAGALGLGEWNESKIDLRKFVLG